MARRPDQVRRRWSGPREPDLFGMPASPAAVVRSDPVPAAKRRSAPVSSEAIERAALGIAAVVADFEARLVEAAAAKGTFAPAAILSRAEVVELLSLGVRHAFSDEARKGFVSSMTNVGFVLFRGWRG